MKFKNEAELVEAYRVAALPFREGISPVPQDALSLKSWRYLVEVNTECNLGCCLCATGNREGFVHKKGTMRMDLLERIADKIQSENPNAIVCPYGSGEPMLHPHFDECVGIIKKRGLTCEVATNLTSVTEKKLAAVVEQKPDWLIVSVSGFTQDIYSRAHRGGNIETVKKNLKLLAKVRDKSGQSLRMSVSFHRYRYNQHEVEPMREFVQGLGFDFMAPNARTIFMEGTVLCLRELERKAGKTVQPFALGEDGTNWNKALPTASENYRQSMEELLFPPVKAIEFYAHWPVAPVCLVADVFTYIRFDGTVQLCAWTDDNRLALGSYLDQTQEQIIQRRWGHPFCQECLRLRLNLYYHVVNFDSAPQT